MGKMIYKRKKDTIDSFRDLLLSGVGYKVTYMYEQVGLGVYLEWGSVRVIVNDYYHSLLTQEMLDFVSNLKGSKNCDVIKSFSLKFKYRYAESRLIIGYIRKALDKQKRK